MKKLIVCSGYYGHVELAPEGVVEDGIFKGLSQRELFERIMQEGYGGGVPAVFHTEFADGSYKVFKGQDAAQLLDRTDVDAVTVIAPIAGGC